MFGIDPYVCGSCAVGALKNIGVFKNPVEVLAAFCKNELGAKNQFTANYMKLTCFYLFCAGPEVKSTEPGGTGHSKNHWPRYGTELAEYITNNGLGTIMTLGPKYNAKHHPNSTAQLWAWSPDQKAVEAWWNKYQQGKL